MPTHAESVLITGANGFIGSRFCRQFLSDGYRVVAGIRETADRSLIDDLNLEFRFGDITQPETLPAMVSGIDYIVHNAGVVKAKRRETFFAVNEQGTRNLLDAVVAHNPDVRKVVLISSLAAAGPSPTGDPIKESDPCHPITTYGESKLAGEQAGLAYADKMHVVAIRPPGVYGPGDKEMFALFQTARKGLKPLIGDLDRRIQLVHVDDLVRGVSMAVQGETKSGEAYFLAESQSYSMREMMTIFQLAVSRKSITLRIPGGLFRVIGSVSETFCKLTGAAPMISREKVGELLADWQIDTGKAREAFGFESKIDLTTGARQTFDWYVRKGWLK